MKFIQGNSYVAGFDKPAIFSVGTIAEKLEEEGFQVAALKPCDEIKGLPFATPGRCGDGWDYIAVVKRLGPTVFVKLPDRVAWVVCAEGCEVEGQPAPTLVANPQASRSRGLSRRTVQVASELTGALVVAPLMWWGGGKVPKKSRARNGLRVGAAGVAALNLYLLSRSLRE